MMVRPKKKKKKKKKKQGSGNPKWNFSILAHGFSDVYTVKKTKKQKNTTLK